MQITCLGASRCVTGSCFLLDNGDTYLVDCGMFQGGKKMEALNHSPWGFEPAALKAVFLTHAHIDHCGRLPKLVKDGFNGPIYCTRPTMELARILLLDSAHIQEMEAEWHSRKNRRRGEETVQPLYTTKDAEACSPLFRETMSDQAFQAGSNLEVCFRNAGHILGSSILEIWDKMTASTHKVVFSGDIGRKEQLIVSDPYPIALADTVFIESTYGNRLHRNLEDSRTELLEAINYSYKHGEKVLIPAFAVERTQEILYTLGEFSRKGKLPNMPVYLDSPLAIAATGIFRRMQEFYDEEASSLFRSGTDPFAFPQLVFSRTAQESMAINQATGPAIVIAGNGMCTAGRIKHHLKHNLWRKGCSLVVVGYQAAGSLGRMIVEGRKSLRILGETVIVRAKVFTIGGFSAHGDQSDLLEWLGHLQSPETVVNVIHGEESTSEEFAALVRRRYGFRVSVPSIGSVIGPDFIKTAEVRPAIQKWGAYLKGIEDTAAVLRERLERNSANLSATLIQEIEQELAATESHLRKLLPESALDQEGRPTSKR